MFLLEETEALKPILPIFGRVLGVDFGLKQQGIAIGEGRTYSVQPLSIIREKSRQKSIDVLLKIIQEWQVKMLVFGYPKQKQEKYYESNAPVLAGLEKYIQLLKKQCQLPIFLCNEHYSSQQARLHKTKREYSRIDDLAATIILQNWFVSLS